MPTENRSSNTEQMVSVPLKLADSIERTWRQNGQWNMETNQEIARGVDELRALLAQPAAKHQADGFSAGDMADQGAKAFRDGQRALVLPERMGESTKGNGWNACLDEVRRLNMLANQGE